MKEWLKKHDACEEAYEAAVANCNTLEECWSHPDIKPEWLIWLATRPRVLPDKKLHEFGLWCAEQVRHLMKDPPLSALDEKRLWLDRKLSDKEWAAVRDAAARAAAEAAWAAGDSAWAAAGAAAGAARAAAWAAARAAARVAQANWLKKNCIPNFK